MDEFRLILRKSEKDMKQVFYEAKFAMEAVMKLMPDDSNHGMNACPLNMSINIFGHCNFCLMF